MLINTDSTILAELLKSMCKNGSIDMNRLFPILNSTAMTNRITNNDIDMRIFIYCLTKLRVSSYKLTLLVHFNDGTDVEVAQNADIKDDYKMVLTKIARNLAKQKALNDVALRTLLRIHASRRKPLRAKTKVKDNTYASIKRETVAIRSLMTLIRAFRAKGLTIKIKVFPYEFEGSVEVPL